MSDTKLVRKKTIRPLGEIKATAFCNYKAFVYPDNYRAIKKCTFSSGKSRVDDHLSFSGNYIWESLFFSIFLFFLREKPNFS